MEQQCDDNNGELLWRLAVEKLRTLLVLSFFLSFFLFLCLLHPFWRKHFSENEHFKACCPIFISLAPAPPSSSRYGDCLLVTKFTHARGHTHARTKARMHGDIQGALYSTRHIAAWWQEDTLRWPQCHAGMTKITSTEFLCGTDRYFENETRRWLQVVKCNINRKNKIKNEWLPRCRPPSDFLLCENCWNNFDWSKWSINQISKHWSMRDLQQTSISKIRHTSIHPYLQSSKLLTSHSIVIVTTSIWLVQLQEKDHAVLREIVRKFFTSFVIR